MLVDIVIQVGQRFVYCPLFRICFSDQPERLGIVRINGNIPLHLLLRSLPVSGPDQHACPFEQQCRVSNMGADHPVIYGCRSVGASLPFAGFSKGIEPSCRSITVPGDGFKDIRCLTVLAVAHEDAGVTVFGNRFFRIE